MEGPAWDAGPGAFRMNREPKDSTGPFDLVPEACEITAEAWDRFPEEETQLAQRSQYIAEGITPLFSEAIRADMFTADEARRAVLNSLRNPPDDVEPSAKWEQWQRRLAAEVETGPAWRRMVAAFEDSERNKVSTAEQIAAMRPAQTTEPAHKPHPPQELPTYLVIRSWGTITQKKAAELLECDPRTIYTRIHQQRRLNANDSGKVLCDDKLKVEMQKKYGSAFRLM